MAVTFLGVNPDKFSYVTGETVKVLVHLTAEIGGEVPVQGANVQILLNNVQVGIGHTDTSGYATVQFKAPPIPGIYVVVGNFYGGVGLDPSTASESINVTQGTPPPEPGAINPWLIVGGLGVVGIVVLIATRK